MVVMALSQERNEDVIAALCDTAMLVSGDGGTIYVGEDDVLESELWSSIYSVN